MNTKKNSNKVLFTRPYTENVYHGELYFTQAVKAFDNQDFDNFYEFVKALESMERRGLILGNWSQRLYASATYKKPEWLRKAEKEFFLSHPGVEGF